MESFIASLAADRLRVALLQHHDHAAAGSDAAWTDHALKTAREAFNQLTADMAALEAAVTAQPEQAEAA